MSNLNAPRLMFSVGGDFIAQTRVEIAQAVEVAAGLLLWGGERDFIRLERVHGEVHGDGVQFEACADGSYSYVGRGRFTARTVWLRLERVGRRVRGLFSEDNRQWWTCGSAAFAEVGPVEVGIVCIALHSGATATFERFAVWNVEYQEANG